MRAQELQRLVLGGTHLLGLARGLVIEPAEVQHPVDDHPVELLVEGGACLLGIAPDRVEADQEIARDTLPLTVVEGELYSLTKTYRRMNTDLINK